MIYNEDRNKKYRVCYYRNSNTKRVPVLDYIQKLYIKDKLKLAAYISFLRDQRGYINEPYSRYVCFGLRELRIEFSHNNHRIFYTIVEKKRIILLHAFLKKTRKTPKKEISHALNNFQDYKLNTNFVKYEE